MCTKKKWKKMRNFFLRSLRIRDDVFRWRSEKWRDLMCWFNIYFWRERETINSIQQLCSQILSLYDIYFERYSITFLKINHDTYRWGIYFVGAIMRKRNERVCEIKPVWCKNKAMCDCRGLRLISAFNF